MRRKKLSGYDLAAYNKLKALVEKGELVQDPSIKIEDLAKFPDEFHVMIHIGYKPSGFYIENPNEHLIIKDKVESFLKANNIHFRSPSEKSMKFSCDWHYHRAIYKIRVNELSKVLQLLNNQTIGDLRGNLHKDFRGFSGSTLEEPKHEWFANVVSHLLKQASNRVNRTELPFNGYARLDSDCNYGNFRY